MDEKGIRALSRYRRRATTILRWRKAKGLDANNLFLSGRLGNSFEMYNRCILHKLPGKINIAPMTFFRILCKMKFMVTASFGTAMIDRNVTRIFFAGIDTMIDMFMIPMTNQSGRENKDRNIQQEQ